MLEVDAGEAEEAKGGGKAKMLDDDAWEMRSDIGWNGGGCCELDTS